MAVNTEKGITIHRHGCPNLKNLLNKPGKSSNVVWDKSDDSEYLSALTLVLKNEPGVLADISKIISSNESNIQDVKTKTLDENFIELAIKINVKDLSHLSLIQNQLKRNKTVTNIYRQLT